MTVKGKGNGGNGDRIRAGIAAGHSHRCVARVTGVCPRTVWLRTSSRAERTIRRHPEADTAWQAALAEVGCTCRTRGRTR